MIAPVPLLLSLLILLAACAGTAAPDALPTLASLPSLTPTTMPSRTPIPTWTPSPAPDIASIVVPSPTATVTPSETPSLAEPSPATPTPTVTPSLTITPTPLPTLTQTPVPTQDTGALGSLIDLALRATILPVTFAPPPLQPTGDFAQPPAPVSCASLPSGGFVAVYSQYSLSGLLGCPAGGETTLVSAFQPFERGVMIYLSGQPGTIYALFDSGQFRAFADTWIEGVDPTSGGETAPPGLQEPIRGFGKVWRANPDVRQGLGWATASEAGNNSRLQFFDRGRLLYMPQQNATYALVEDASGMSGTWRSFPGGA